MEGSKSKKRPADAVLSKAKGSPAKKAKTVKDGKRKRKGKSSDGPVVKRASSAYIHFTSDFRAKLKEKCSQKGDPLPKANEVAKMAGEQWKKLSEEERKPYVQKAEEDKARYLRESGKTAKAESDKPKRAPTAYFLFLAEFRKDMEGKEADGKKIPALAGEKWRSMTDKDKEKFKQMEEVAKKKHAAEMDEWKKKNAAKEAAKPKVEKKKPAPRKEVRKVSESEEDEEEDDDEEEEEEEEEEAADEEDEEDEEDDDDDDDDDDDE